MGRGVGTGVGTGVGAGVYDMANVALSEAQEPSEQASVRTYELIAALPGTTCECEPSLSIVSLWIVDPSSGSWMLASTDGHDEPSP